MLLCHVPVKAGGREELLGSAYSNVEIGMRMRFEDGMVGEKTG